MITGQRSPPRAPIGPKSNGPRCDIGGSSLSSKCAPVNNTRLLVAVVDDEEAVRIALRRLLRSASLSVETFSSGAEFLESVREQQPDCVVPDLHMPHLGGFAVQARRGGSGRRRESAPALSSGVCSINWGWYTREATMGPASARPARQASSTKTNSASQPATFSNSPRWPNYRPTSKPSGTPLTIPVRATLSFSSSNLRLHGEPNQD